jgi:hypothetical protein
MRVVPLFIADVDSLLRNTSAAMCCRATNTSNRAGLLGLGNFSEYSLRFAPKQNLTRHPKQRLYRRLCVRVIREIAICNSFVHRLATGPGDCEHATSTHLQSEKRRAGLERRFG